MSVSYKIEQNYFDANFVPNSYGNSNVLDANYFVIKVISKSFAHIMKFASCLSIGTF